MTTLIRFNDAEFNYLSSVKITDLELLKKELRNKILYHYQYKSKSCLEYYVLKRLLKKIENLNDEQYQQLLGGKY